MTINTTILLESLVLVIALCIDSFVACFAYGTNRVRIPLASLLIMDCLCSGILIGFLFLGNLLNPLLPPGMVKVLCFFILFILGLLKLFDSSIKIMIQRVREKTKYLQFSFHNIQFILAVYADPNEANTDQSNTLSPAEAVSLGIALSLDSAVVGLGAGMDTFSLPLLLILSLVIGALSLFGGCLLGQKLAERTPVNLSWISGVLLLILAFLKLV